MEGPGLEPDSESESDPLPLLSSVNLAAFSPIPSPSTLRLSSYFTGPHRPVESARRRKLAYLSLQGLLVNAEEASSARSIGGRLSPEEAVAWELFTPIQRFLIVAVIGVAAAESKKNKEIQKLRRAADLRDQLLSSMQQKLDDLCEQLNLVKDQSGTGPNVSDDDNHLQQVYKETFGSETVKFVDCGCWLCIHHHHLLPCLQDKPFTKASMGHEMWNETTNLVPDAEPEERRMSDMSDWCSSVTSAAEIQFNNLSLDQDMLYLKKECQEKDATIKELSSCLQSTNKTSSKRLSELEDIIRRKNTIITRLKKDKIVLEEQVTQLTRLRRTSSAAFSNSREFPLVRDNLLYDMDISTSPSSSDSETPVSTPRPTTPKVPIDPTKEFHSTSEQTHKSAPTKPTAFHASSAKTPSVSPLQEVSVKRLSVSSSTRLRRASSSEVPRKPKKPVNGTARDSSGSRKRWT